MSELGEIGLARMRRRLGMLFQSGALLDSMTVFDNVAFPLREHTDLPRKEVRERVMEKLAALGVAAAAHKLPAQLSGGMQKRVAVARAMILESEILIYDEPTTGLDPITLGNVVELIRRLNDALGLTSIVVTHDMGSAQAVSDRMAMVHRGAIIKVGPPEDFVDPADPRKETSQPLHRVIR